MCRGEEVESDQWRLICNGANELFESSRPSKKASSMNVVKQAADHFHKKQSFKRFIETMSTTEKLRYLQRTDGKKDQISGIAGLSWEKRKN